MNNQMPFGLPNMPQFNQPPMGPGMGMMPNMPCTCSNEIERLNNKVSRLERQIRGLENRILRLENPNQGVMPLNNSQGSSFQSDMYMI